MPSFQRTAAASAWALRFDGSRPPGSPLRSASFLLAAALWLGPAISTARTDPAPAPVDSTATPPDRAQPESTAAPASSLPALAQRVRRLGLENVVVDPRSDSLRVRYENRHFRHTTEALGSIARVAGGPVLGFEARLDLTSATITDSNSARAGFRVSYPTDRDFPRPPAGEPLAPTRHSVDLLLDPLFTYSLGDILDQVMTRWEIQTELRYNPWSGARLRAAMIFPVHDDFPDVDPAHPDVKQTRPGPILLDQFFWTRMALFSGTAGVLGDNRYGFSLGAARPLHGGEILLDAQSDFTGYMAFEDSGFVYSAPNRWTGFADVTYHPPGLDLGVRLRLARYLFGDEGVELELRRAMGDLDVALFAQRTHGENTGGVRLGIPLPPMVRPVGWPVRVLPVERLAFEYREESIPIGETVKNVASRAELLRQLDPPALNANRYRYEEAREGRRHHPQNGPPQWVSLTGMTGFINTPWAGVMGDKDFELGYDNIPKEASYDHRGQYPNEVYYAALGFLPHVEVGLRWTVIPGYHPYRALVPESPYVDADRMFSGRIEILTPRPWRPGFAVGGEDLRGTRRFHSTYGVAGMPFDIYRLQSRVTLGYAPRVFTASRYTLDGLFGAYEISVRRTVAAALEYDSEKWNTMLGINLGFGLRARIALLDLEHLSLGAGWFRAL